MALRREVEMREAYGGLLLHLFPDLPPPLHILSSPSCRPSPRAVVPVPPYRPKKTLLAPTFSISTKPSSTRPWLTSFTLQIERGDTTEKAVEMKRNLVPVLPDTTTPLLPCFKAFPRLSRQCPAHLCDTTPCFDARPSISFRL